MGYLKDLKNQVKSATAMGAEMRASMATADTTVLGPASPSTEPAIINPTPQATIDEMLSAGRVGRAVTVRARHDMSDGDRPVRTRVHVTVRQRLHGGSLGDEVDLKAWVGWKVAALLEPGLEVPVELDATTRSVSGIDTRSLASELSSRNDEAKRRHRGFDVDLGLDGITQAPAVVKDFLQPPPPSPPGMSHHDPNQTP